MRYIICMLFDRIKPRQAAQALHVNTVCQETVNTVSYVTAVKATLTEEYRDRGERVGEGAHTPKPCLHGLD